MTDNDIKEAVENCYWRKKVCDAFVCVGNILPCEMAIDTGRCDAIRELFKKEGEKVEAQQY